MKRIKLFLALLGFITIGQIALGQSGSTFTDPVVITSLPVLETGSTTCGFGNNYSTLDIACVGNFMSGEEKIYSFTPTANMLNVEVAVRNVSDNFSGLFITDDSTASGTCIASVYNPGSTDRVVSNLSLTAGTTYYIIVSTWANPNCLSFDFQVLDQTCPAPANIFASTPVAHNSADLNWIEMGSATQWEVEYGLLGFTPGTGSSSIATSMPHTISSLSVNSTYDVYVRAICGAGDSSYWVGPYSFTTGCAPVTDYTEDFIGLPTNTVPTCWNGLTSSSITTSAYARTTSSSSPNSGNRHIRMSNSNDTNALVFLVGPAVSNIAAGTHRLTFFAKNSNSGDMIVGTITDPSDVNTFTPVDTIHTNGVHTQYFVDFDAYSGTDAYTAIRSVHSVNYDYFFVDDVVWEAIPACIAPRNLAATTGNTTATLSWFEPGTATSWEVEYDYAGFTPGTGTVVAASSNPFTISTLTPDTTYEYYVRSVCGVGNNSVWVGPFGFLTDCNPTGAPFLDDVEAHATTRDASIENCWVTNPSFLPNTYSIYSWNVDGSGSTPTSNTGPSSAYSGTNFFYIESSNGGSGDVATLTSPLIDLSAVAQPRLQFRYHMYGSATGNLYVEALNGSNWTVVDSIIGEQHFSSASPWSLRVIYLTGFTGATKVRFTAVKTGDTWGDISLDDFEIINTPSCPEPSSLVASNLTSTSADLSWFENGSATQWEIEYGPAGFAPGLGIKTVATTNPHNVSSLSTGTPYDFYVKAICSASDTSVHSVAGHFSTTCVLETLPYANDFSSWPLTCWDMSGGSDNWGQYGTSNIAEASFWSGIGDMLMTTPEILISADAQISWDWSHRYYSPSPGDSLSIEVKILPSGAWTSIWNRAGADLASNDGAGYTSPGSFVTDTVLLDPATYTGQSVQFRFNATSDDGPDLFVTNLLVEAVPTCLSPSDIIASNIAGTSMNIGWTENNTATQWEIEYGPTGFIQGTGTTVLTSSNPHSVTGLTAQTDYTFCVRAVCGPTDSSLTTCAEFTTGCLPITSFTEGFEGVLIPAMPTCWTGLATSTTGATPFVRTYGFGSPNNGTQHVRIYNSSDVDAGMYLISPALSNVGAATHRLRFYAKCADSYPIVIGTMSDPGDESTFTPRATITTNTSYTEYFVSLGNYSGTDEYVVLKPEHSKTYDYTYIDDVVWEARPSCLRPTNLTATPSFTSADLGWVENGSATAWEVEYGAPGFTLGTGTTVSATTNPYTLSSLSVNTSYEYYVRAVCGLNDSSAWHGPLEFITHCSPAVSPFLDDVELHTATRKSEIANCWTADPNFLPSTSSAYSWNVDASGSTPSGSTGPASAHSGSKYFYVEASNSGTDASLYTPFVDVSSLTAPRLQFYYHMYGADMGNLYIEAYDGANWNTVDSIIGQQHTSASSAWSLKTVYLTSYTGNIQVRFKAVKVGTGYRGDISLDDISFSESPTCIEPVNMSISNVTTTTLDLGWANHGSATQFIVEYDTAGFVLGTGTNNTLTSNNPYSVTALSPNTTYDFYVRSYCGVGDSSIWVGPITVTTPCTSINSFPFLENFDVTSPTIGCWTTTPISGSANWTLASGAGGGSITIPAVGGYNARFISNGGNVADLVTPTFDLTSLIAPRVSFYYAQEESFGSQNYLRLMYRISSTDPWVEIWSDSNNVDSWTNVIVDLPSPSATYQLAFQGIANWGEANVVDEVLIEDTPANDLAVISISYAGEICGLGLDTIKAIVVNNGSVAQTGYQIAYSMNGVAITPEVVSSTVAAFDTIEYSFTTLANFAGPGTYAFEAYTMLTGDVNTANDTAVTDLSRSYNISSYPYYETFATGMQGWSIDNETTGNWEFGTPNKNVIDGASSDTNCFVTGLTSPYGANDYSFVNSPCFDFTTLENPNVQMDVWWHTDFGWDGASLQYTTDEGATWTELGNEGEGVNWYNTPSISANGMQAWSGNGPTGSNGWTTATISATDLAGEPKVQFRVAFASFIFGGGFDGFAFDDFAVYEAASLGDDTVLCTNDTMTITPGNYSGYLWNDSSIVPLKYLDAAVLPVGIDTLDVIVSGINGFKMYDTIVVTVEKPVVLLGNDTVVCFGESFTLDAGAGFVSYLWNDNSVMQTLVTDGNSAGATDYSVVALTANDCPATDTINVSVNTQVLVDLGADTVFSDSTTQGSSYVLDAGPGFASYLWHDGSTAQTFIAGQNKDGDISVVVTNASGCEGSDTVSVIFVLSVNSLEVSEITMYPNPTTDRITIEVSNFTSLGDVNVKVLDITGKVVMSEKLSGNGNMFNETYDVSGLATGTYFVQFEANGEVVTRQFVIK